MVVPSIIVRMGARTFFKAPLNMFLNEVTGVSRDKKLLIFKDIPNLEMLF